MNNQEVWIGEVENAEAETLVEIDATEQPEGELLGATRTATATTTKGDLATPDEKKLPQS
jgi:hypothetical protein